MSDEEKKEMKQLIARLPVDTHRQFKAVCVLQGRPMQQVLESLIHDYVEKSQGRR